MLHRKYRRKVGLPNINFTITQLKTANTQLFFLLLYPIPQKPLIYFHDWNFICWH